MQIHVEVFVQSC